MVAVSAMPSVAAVHEYVQQGASQYQQKWPVLQIFGQVRPVLGDEEVGGNGCESDKDPFGSGCRFLAVVGFMLVFMIHIPLL
jgi:hypothetical protein